MPSKNKTNNIISNSNTAATINNFEASIGSGVCESRVKRHATDLIDPIDSKGGKILTNTKLRKLLYDVSVELIKCIPIPLTPRDHDRVTWIMEME